MRKRLKSCKSNPLELRKTKTNVSLGTMNNLRGSRAPLDRTGIIRSAMLDSLLIHT
ncbi:hypothetical protein MPTK1_3g18600 [Marchantia polymorpha subsp. ruderalis]|uniref:Uncharacterized protein n=2 Tax=Marchantia polymorpha TaxID=3197 RepID=A0AAF6B290_MARPO|nr:hypothetical protein MARPO_0142s0033 [Marchantia polymorpha]BBN06124.1 hypothetical protein Mp_3g18600 [Marchantia polymorpha subsp. ruderalis]|eukprot:PTQ29406.1 hypothetical protein MARPO_0142s0033 [Marchantia polymorpha]